MDRRQFLRRTGALCASVSASALLGTTAGCSGPSPTPATASTTSAPPGPPTWSELAQSLTGSLVLPSDTAFATAKLLYNERFDGVVTPAAIARCASVSDVQRCVDFTRRSGVAITARSGGHSYGGYSLCDGLVVDVGALSSISLDRATSTATVGAGALLIDIYDTLGTEGVLVPGGSCPTVGIAGLTLGGGIGVFDRLYGLTCDNLRSLRIVIADGSTMTADPSEHANLLWACQGGGGGNFGIVTSFDFAVQPVPADLSLFTLDWPWSAATEVLGAWQGWVPTQPDELWSNCELSSGPSGELVRVSGVFVGTPGTLDSLLAPLISAAGSQPSGHFVGSESYLSAMFVEAGCAGKTVSQCHLPTQTADGTLPRAAYAAKSTYVLDAFGSSALAATLEAVASAQQVAPGFGVALLFDAYGGAINRVPASATAFVHRDALAGVQMTASWGSGAEPADASAWLDQAASALAPYTTGAYQNYIDPTLADWQDAYYGANLPRLVEVKRAVDPEDLFHFAQSIPTTLSS